ncbi:hypothetical protein BKN38_09885 [Helicobacter sp. CLO-3]|nr:hypothetical protein BA723_08800 [Helicobacter sp. CLO-3]OHU81038.1 hypothetical protein BKN38_09885 [Helicobacter sp. CLO-3]
MGLDSRCVCFGYFECIAKEAIKKSTYFRALFSRYFVRLVSTRFLRTFCAWHFLVAFVRFCFARFGFL